MDKRGIEYRCTDLTPIVPLPTGDAVKTLTRAKHLYEAGVYVNPVLPPATGPLDCLLRTSYMATHTDALLDEAMDIMKKVIETEEKQ